MSDAGTVRHYQIIEENRMFHLEDQGQAFHKFRYLVDYYQNVPKDRRIYLLQGLAKTSFHQNLGVRHSQPTYLSYFHGEMTDKVDNPRCLNMCN